MTATRDSSPVGRRAVITVLAGLTLSACSAPTRPAPMRTSPIAVPTRTTPHTGPPPSPSPSPTAAGQIIPTRAQVIEQFANRRPTYWGLEAPGVVQRLPRGAKGIALTFDCCGGPGGEALDVALLDALRTSEVRSTFFLNARWIQANLDLSAELAADPLVEIANHGAAHLPLSMTGNSAYGISGTRNVGEVYDEVMGNQDVLQRLTGTAARYFRPGTAFLDDVSAEVVRALGLVPVNFSINGDAGATFAAVTVQQVVGGARAGDIVIAHANRPGGGTAAGVAAALPELLARGTTFVRLSDALR